MVTHPQTFKIKIPRGKTLLRHKAYSTCTRENNNKADELLKKGKYSRAIKRYSKAIGSCPTSDIIIYRRGLAKYYSGDLEGALNDFERVADMDSHLADPMLTKLSEVANYAKSELQLYSLN